MSTRSTRMGFTLVELALVILVMGLLCAIGVPTLQGLNRRQQLEGTTRHLAAQLRIARERAISTGTSQSIHFTPDYPRGTTMDYHLHNGVVGSGWSFPRGVGYFGGSPSLGGVTFSPEGRASASGLIVLSDARGALDTLSIQLSGIVQTR